MHTDAHTVYTRVCGDPRIHTTLRVRTCVHVHTYMHVLKDVSSLDGIFLLAFKLTRFVCV